MDENNDLLTPEQRQAAAEEAMRILSYLAKQKQRF